jgi:hypothetical protein
MGNLGRVRDGSQASQTRVPQAGSAAFERAQREDWTNVEASPAILKIGWGAVRNRALPRTRQSSGRRASGLACRTAGREEHAERTRVASDP